jgi:hypothetical protein
MQLPRFDHPGHWATGGQRSEQLRTRGAGSVSVISVIDDHSRLAYCELHGAEDRLGLSDVLCEVGVTDAARWAGKGHSCLLRSQSPLRESARRPSSLRVPPRS